MKMRWLLVVSAVTVVAVGAGLGWRAFDTPAAPKYVAVPVAKGDVIRTVVTTGSVNPVVTVQVGSYVSGPVKSLLCDFNTKVKAGQLCAKIDPRPYQVIVDQDRATLAIAKAQLEKDTASLDRKSTRLNSSH